MPPRYSGSIRRRWAEWLRTCWLGTYKLHELPDCDQLDRDILLHDVECPSFHSRQSCYRTLSPITESTEEDEDEDMYPQYPSRTPSPTGSIRSRVDPALAIIGITGVGWTAGLYLAYPFPTTIHVYIGGLVVLFGWTVLGLSRLVVVLLQQHSNRTATLAAWSASYRARLAVATIALTYLATLGWRPPDQVIPDLPGGRKYFIAANLHDNDEVLPRWQDQVVRLAFHLGRDNVFVSIFESNSVDSTKPLLSTLNDSLSNLNVNHRIITTDDEARHWPYPQSRERIEYLANARNKAMEPLQSPDPTVRLENWNEYTTVVFLNDAWFSWEDVVRLIATETEDGGDYDLACGMDFGWSGLYDTWVARDICGTPLRPFFPYVKDPVSARKVRDEQPFAVSACWNGMVAFPSGPFLWSPESTENNVPDITKNRNDTDSSFQQPHMRKRGWRSIDSSNNSSSLASPPLVTPLQFHPSPFQACDHSECFLMSYDLHRLYNTTERPARIVMNPKVRVAYEQNWWKWQNVVLRVPIIRFWVDHWSRGWPLSLIDWVWEIAGRRRDYCTWTALGIGMPDRCPSLPGAADKSWDM